MRKTKVPLRKGDAPFGKGYQESEIAHDIVISDPPYDLGDDALEEFRKVVPLLDQRFDLTAIDLRMIAVYCTEIARYWQCELVLRDKGLTMETSTGYLAQRPEVSIGKNALMSARAIAEQFGFTVMSRKKIFDEKVHPKTRRSPGVASRFQDRWEKIGGPPEKIVTRYDH